MYLIGIILFIAFMVGTTAITASPWSFVDFPSLLVILAVTVPILLAGALGTLVGLVGMLTHLDDPTKIGPAVAVALLTTIYSIVLLVVILPIRAKVDAVIDTMEDAN